MCCEMHPTLNSTLTPLEHLFPDHCQGVGVQGVVGGLGGGGVGVKFLGPFYRPVAKTLATSFLFNFDEFRKVMVAELCP